MQFYYVNVPPISIIKWSQIFEKAKFVATLIYLLRLSSKHLSNEANLKTNPCPIPAPCTPSTFQNHCDGLWLLNAIRAQRRMMRQARPRIVPSFLRSRTKSLEPTSFSELATRFKRHKWSPFNGHLNKL